MMMSKVIAKVMASFMVYGNDGIRRLYKDVKVRSRSATYHKVAGPHSTLWPQHLCLGDDDGNGNNGADGDDR